MALCMISGAGAATSLPSEAHAAGPTCELLFPVTATKLARVQRCLADRATPFREVLMTTRGIRWI
jgi:hypothetical protein